MGKEIGGTSTTSSSSSQIPANITDKILFYETKNNHPIKTSIFVLNIISLFLFAVIKDSIDISTKEGISKCNEIQYISLTIAVVITIIIQIISIMMVLKEQRIKKNNHVFNDKSDIDFNIGKIFCIICFSFICGVFINLLGLEGTFLIGPIFACAGVDIDVAFASSIFLVFFSKILASILGFMKNYFLPGYTFLSAAISFFSILFFIKVIGRSIEK